MSTQPEIVQDGWYYGCSEHGQSVVHTFEKWTRRPIAECIVCGCSLVAAHTVRVGRGLGSRTGEGEDTRMTTSEAVQRARKLGEKHGKTGAILWGEGYSATQLAIDIGGTWTHPKAGKSLGLLLRGGIMEWETVRAAYEKALAGQ